MVDDQEELLRKLEKTNNLNEIQNYIKQVIDIRGFGCQTIQENMLLLSEEVGELAKAIRKEIKTMSIDTEKLYNYDTIESEIADVFIVLNNISNKLNINIFDSLIKKEKINIKRSWKKNQDM